MSAEEAKPTGSSVKELERFRDILYGEQARATEDRLGDLEKRLEKVRSELIHFSAKNTNPCKPRLKSKSVILANNSMNMKLRPPND